MKAEMDYNLIVRINLLNVTGRYQIRHVPGPSKIGQDLVLKYQEIL